MNVHNCIKAEVCLNVSPQDVGVVALNRGTPVDDVSDVVVLARLQLQLNVVAVGKRLTEAEHGSHCEVELELTSFLVHKFQL